MPSEAEVMAAARAVNSFRYRAEAPATTEIARAALEAAERVREAESARKLVGLGVEMGIPKHEAEAELGIGPVDKGRKAE
jgi:hypothetical protein